MLTKDRQGGWVPPKRGEPVRVVSVYSGVHYEPPLEVRNLLQDRQRMPIPYRSQVPPLLSAFPTDEAKLEHIDAAWKMVYRRKVGRAIKSPKNAKLGVLPATILQSGRILTQQRIPPVLWYWWGWGREEFYFYRNRIKLPTPSFKTFWQPRRVEHLAPFLQRTRDDTWRKPPPKIPSVETVLHWRSSMSSAVYTTKPVTASEARITLDAICAQDEYDRLLAVANTDVLRLMQSEADDLAAGKWVWG